MVPRGGEYRENVGSIPRVEVPGDRGGVGSLGSGLILRDSRRVASDETAADAFTEVAVPYLNLLAAEWVLVSVSVSQEEQTRFLRGLVRFNPLGPAINTKVDINTKLTTTNKYLFMVTNDHDIAIYFSW